jgi:outer membrane receptor protein involved in Fe transport
MNATNLANRIARRLGGAGRTLARLGLWGGLCGGLWTVSTLHAAEDAQGLEEVLVTGSRIARDGMDASTPVTVVSAVDIKMSGAVNIEETLSDAPQFVASTNGGATANTVPGGTADINLRGFGPTRNLVLVNGRRFAIYGPEQVTDLNTIPAALIARTEIVTGGSSAVYGSDAITGVVNFIMRDDFEGVEVNAQTTYDSPTTTPTYTADLTVGGNFAAGRGNAVVSVNYLNRGSITRGERGDWAFYSLSDGCVTPASFSDSAPGVPVTIPAGSTCRGAGGVPGLIAGGSGDIPNGRFTGVPAPGTSASSPALDAALVAAGLGGLGSRGFTFDDAGLTARPALTPQDDFNLGPDNYLQVPQERWMLNAFSHYDLHDKITGYLEFHFSNNRVDQQLAATNINGPFLFNINNPYLSTSMREVLRQLDLRETAPSTVVTGTTSMVNNPNDGLAVLNVGRRLVEVPLRRNISDRNVWRTAVGFRGELGDVSENFLRNLSYDVYYSFARTEETSRQEGNVSRSRFQAGVLSVGGAAPVVNPFGQNISDAGVSAIQIGATNVTQAELQVAAANLSGQAFDLPAGPVGFSFGTEWRYTSADFVPDEFLRSGDVVGFNAGLPTGGSVTAKEVYGEVRVPLLANVPLIKNLTANSAFRYSDYDLEGVGAVWTYLYGLDWRLTDDVALRGQFQRAIRAPNVAELYGGSRRSVEPATDPCSSGQPVNARTAAVRQLCIQSGVPAALVFGAGVQPNTIIEAFFGGNPNVGEESSDTRTLGAVITPRALPNLAVSIDYFDITLDGAIAQLGGGLNNTLNLCFNVIQDIDSEFCRAISRNPVTGEIGTPYTARINQANTGALETSGIDLQARYRFDVGWGLFGRASSFDLSSSWTWTDEFTSTPVEAFPNVKNYCAGAYGTTCGEPIPQYKGVTRLTWNAGPLSLSLRHRYIDEVTVDRYLLPKRSGAAFPALSDLVNPRLPAQHYLDLSFIYDWGKAIELSGGIRNLLDNDPPIVGSAQIRANTWPATYDTNGREFFVGVNLKL